MRLTDHPGIRKILTHRIPWQVRKPVCKTGNSNKGNDQLFGKVEEGQSAGGKRYDGFGCRYTCAWPRTLHQWLNSLA